MCGAVLKKSQNKQDNDRTTESKITLHYLKKQQKVIVFYVQLIKMRFTAV